MIGKHISSLLIVAIAFLLGDGLAEAQIFKEPTAQSSKNERVYNLASDKPKTFQVYDNYDAVGAVYNTLQAIELKACFEACQSDGQCSAFSFDKWRKTCRLKRSADSLRFDPTSVVGLPTDKALPPSSNAPIIVEQLRGNSFPGRGYRTFPATSAEQCELVCKDDENCVAFTQYSEPSVCKLLDTIDLYSADPSAHSGLKRQQDQTLINNAADNAPNVRAAISECDRLAAAPSAEMRRAGIAGIEFEQIDADKAIPACRAAVAAQPNDGRLLSQLGRALQKSGHADAIAEALLVYRRAAAAGSSVAMNNLGVFYNSGTGVAKDEAEAARWFRKAADAGIATAKSNLGAMYLDGHGVEKNAKEAARLFREASDSGLVAGTYKLGILYRDGLGVDKNASEAARLFGIAAEGGVQDAMNDLGVLYANGVGVQKNAAEAVNWYRRAAEAGSPLGMLNLGGMYREGVGVSKDLIEAGHWTRKAADAGLPLAMLQLANMYQSGLGIAKDNVEAFRWYKRSAEAGTTEAMSGLGFMYGTGTGTRKNVSEAVKWYRKAADGGSLAGKTNLGAMYAAGAGIQRDNAKAIELFREAADGEFAPAITHLAAMYEDGRGTRKNMAKALAWYRKAAAAGDPVATAQLRRLSK